MITIENVTLEIKELIKEIEQANGGVANGQKILVLYADLHRAYVLYGRLLFEGIKEEL